LGLSHSGTALLIAWSPAPIGVDLECADRRLQARALMTRFFPGLECQQLAGLAQNRLHEAVLRSWVLKEAAIKWRCRSLAQELSSWRFDHHGGELCHGQEGLRPPWRAGLVGRWRWAAVGAGVEGWAAGMADQGQPGGWLTSQSATRALQKTHKCC
jgi:phosphopantetheinyl transferase